MSRENHGGSEAAHSWLCAISEARLVVFSHLALLTELCRFFKSCKVNIWHQVICCGSLRGDEMALCTN